MILKRAFLVGEIRGNASNIDSPNPKGLQGWEREKGVHIRELTGWRKFETSRAGKKAGRPVAGIQ